MTAYVELPIWSELTDAEAPAYVTVVSAEALPFAPRRCRAWEGCLYDALWYGLVVAPDMSTMKRRACVHRVVTALHARLKADDRARAAFWSARWSGVRDLAYQDLAALLRSRYPEAFEA